MAEIKDKLLLFFSCFILYLLEVHWEYSIIPVLLAVITSSLSTYLVDRRLKLGFFLIYIACCQLIPYCFVFLPLIIYDIAYYDYQFLGVLILFPLLLNFNYFTPAIIAFTIMFFILCWNMKYRTLTYQRIRTEYNELQDTSKELALVQEQKNQSLLENQDYEINVATLNERNRISKEIHDNIGHLLSRSLLQIGALLTITKEETTKEGLTSLKNSISEGMDSVRFSIHNMHDESIDLYTVVDTLVKEFSFCKINFEYDIKSSPDIKLKYTIIAIIKEGLANIIKHSDATKVQLSLREHPAMYQLILSDNGMIDDIKQLRLRKLYENQIYQDGMGIQNITDRVKSFQGNINFNFDKGFRIFISIPKK